MQKENYIWGAGHYGVLTALGLEKKDVKIKGFIDKNATQIKTRLGLPVLAPNSLLSGEKKSYYIIIAVENECARKEIMQTLSSFGLNKHEDFEFSSLIQIPPEPFKMYKWKMLNSFIPRMEVQLTEHCNLNCANCFNNCPVAEPSFLNIEQFELDFAKLSKLTSGRIGIISLTGGEPLLNPDIVKVMQIARNNFPNTEIRIITNGILLTKMKEDFWIACKNNEIPITISQYPIKLDTDKISQTAEKYAVDVFWNATMEVDNTRIFAVRKYDMNGKQDIYESYEKCSLKKCTFIEDGKIYLCQQIYNSKILEKAFNIKFSISNEDFLDLDKIKNIQEILDFISHPSPFCRYCYVNCKAMQWRTSEKKKEEWIL